MTDFGKLLNSLASVKVGVIGDVMLDTYMWGRVERISPEAPVPVVTVEKKEYRIGGAGNVALNLKALGAAVSVLSITGGDSDGHILIDLFKQNNINTKHLLKANDRITTNKTRVLSRSQQMMRLDAEIALDITEEQQQQLLKEIKEFIETEKPQVIIFEDYNKGVLTVPVINEVIKLCREAGIITAVDPKQKNFFAYKGADIFKPNMKEVRDALSLSAEEVSLTALQQIHGELNDRLQHCYSFITLSEKGVFFQGKDESGIIPSHVRSIADVSGAGDTVIATASLVYAATGSMQLAAEIANIAGGLVCEEVGTVAVNKERLLKECSNILRR